MAEVTEEQPTKKQRTGNTITTVDEGTSDTIPKEKNPLRFSALQRCLFETSDSTLGNSEGTGDWTHWVDDEEEVEGGKYVGQIPPLTDSLTGTNQTGFIGGITNSTQSLLVQLSGINEDVVSHIKGEPSEESIGGIRGPLERAVSRDIITDTSTSSSIETTSIPSMYLSSVASTTPSVGTTTPTSAMQVAYIARVISDIKNCLVDTRERQRSVLSNIPPNPHHIDELSRILEEVQSKAKEAVETLVEINNRCILSAQDARNVVVYKDELRLDSIHLEVLQEELKLARDNEQHKAVARLIITSQPFPCTVKQSKSLDDDIKIKLITGATVSFKPIAHVKAELINEDYTPQTKRKSATPPVQNDEAPMNEMGEAVFQKMTMTHGTRVKTINLRFSVNVALNGVTTHLQSDASKPFIVMTNHGQRSTTEGKLLKKETFGTQPEIQWPAFANAMHMHYLQATKQDPSRPTRPLTLRDIDYLQHTKFSGKEWINQEDYDNFWEWFGTILYKIRNHQKHILPMWTKGLIYGFLSRANAQTLLSDQQAGSFLIRFSDRCAGLFVVVYVEEDPTTSSTTVKHYLIQPEEIEKKQTLPDFLRDCQDLKYLLQIVRSDSGDITLNPREKEEVLKAFYSRDKARHYLFGYDDRKPS